MDYIHDAAGKIEQVTSVEVDRTLTKYDGDGQTLYQYKGGYDEETSEYSLNGYTAYFVRSSVLGGAVISEPNFQGGKRKTYVYAGGSVLAVQETGSPNNFVRWEHRDPSGTSFRNSDSENGNWSFQTLQEFDPMGANTGLSTPISGGGAIPTEDLVSSLLYPNQPPAWSGQRVTYTLNGMPINADEARFLLDNGGARPSWLDTAQFLLGLELPFNSLGGGLYSVRFPSHRVDGVLHNLTLYGFLFTGQTGQISRQPLTQQEAEKAINDAIPEAEKIARNKKCMDFLQKLYIEAFKKINGGTLNEETEKYLLKNEGSIDSFLKNLKDAVKVIKPSVERRENATTQGNTVTFYRGTFQQKSTRDIITDGGPSTRWENRTTKSIAQTLIHEAIHLWVRQFTDEFIGELISDKKKVDRDTGSEIINKAVAENCK